MLNGEDISATMRTMLKENIEASVASFCAGEIADDWDFAALRRHYLGWLARETDFHYTTAQLEDLTKEQIAQVLIERGEAILEAKEKKYGSPLMRELERICLLRNVDTKWMDHIDNMDQLRQGIYLRGYGQRDPVIEYRIEGFEMFDEMIESIKEDAVRMLLTVEIRTEQPMQRTQVAKPSGDAAVPGKGVKSTGKNGPVKVQKIGRNDPCPCGSGLKWKKCTCAQYHSDL